LDQSIETTVVLVPFLIVMILIVAIIPKQYETYRGASCKFLDVGTRFRVILDRPIATDGKKLHGKVRPGDYRWDKTPRTIENVSLKPGQPPLYTLSGVGNALYTREQLQWIDTQETAPPETAQRK
jgi:hypothetical protein